ncbi:MAG: folylpolyglutamate synthase/dihydrofolate synthase family protein [Geobacter sp.]
MAVSTALAELFGRRRFAIQPGTERIKALLARLGNPERSFQSIHVVGTNGKGSSASFLASILTTAGHRSGLFTSPHLISYTERFRVDGQTIPQQRLDQLVGELLAIAGPEDTFFELTTALACCWFAECGAQLVVFEAGMGGQADATAAIPALATLITPIALDHQQWLGASLTAIAAEKAAIAEAGSPLICAPQQPEALAAIVRRCRSNNNRLLLAERDFTAHWETDNSLSYHGQHTAIDGLTPGIPGRYQLWNAACALATAEQLAAQGWTVPVAALGSGIASVRWPGRMEPFSLPNNVELVLDGAHNPAGATALAESLRQYHADRRIILVLGVMADKELAGLLPPLLPLSDRIITVAPDQERALGADQLAAQCAQQGHKALSAGSVEAGIAAAQQLTRPGDLIVVAGSLFTVGEARAALTGQTCCAVRG